nr:unnamed protein product [Digitaria exilis]
MAMAAASVPDLNLYRSLHLTAEDKKKSGTRGENSENKNGDGRCRAQDAPACSEQRRRSSRRRHARSRKRDPATEQHRAAPAWRGRERMGNDDDDRLQLPGGGVVEEGHGELQLPGSGVLEEGHEEPRLTSLAAAWWRKVATI